MSYSGVYVDREYKVAVIGSQGVGKTRLHERLMAPNAPLSDYIPRVADIRSLVKYSTQSVSAANLQLVDTVGGFDDYMAARLRPLSLIGSTVMLVAFSVTNRASFEELPRFFDEVDRFYHGVPVIVVGTKIDARIDANDNALPPGVVHVTTEEAIAEIKDKHNLFYVEVSAERSDNLDELVDLIIDAVVSNEQRLGPFTPSAKSSSKPSSTGFMSSVRRVFGFGSGATAPRRKKRALK